MRGNMNRAIEIAENLTKEELLKRMCSYVKQQAKRRKLPEWSMVGHIFAQGSGVSHALWDLYINDAEIIIHGEQQATKGEG